MKIVPGKTVQTATFMVAEMQVQPVVCNLFESLPTARGFFTERAGAPAGEGNPAESVLEAVGIPANPLSRTRKYVVITEVWEAGIVPHLVDDLELSVSQLPQQQDVLYRLGFN